ncbi:MAG TPA: ribose ABC transporter permease, partial [Fimbriimonadaceae bacterium]|nr:ribose ABC transporter permease [Fimbriimonadaceae bacterium]
MNRIGGREMVLGALLVGLLIAAKILEPRFVTLPAQTLLSTHLWELAIVALPLFVVILSGGIDLSVGSILALSGVTLGLLFERGLSPWFGSLAAILVGGVAGSLNGWFIAKYRVHPLIITLASMAAFRGIAEGISLARPISGYPESFQNFSQGKLLGIPYPGWIFFLLAVGVGFAV